MNKNINYQKYLANVFVNDVKINKIIRNKNNTYNNLKDKKIHFKQNDINRKIKKQTEKQFYRTLNVILTDIENLHVEENEYNLEPYDMNKIHTSFSLKLYLINFWIELLTKNVLKNKRNVVYFKRQFCIDYISYISFIVSLINNRNISLHITITSHILDFNILQLLKINIKQLVQKTLKYEYYYGKTSLTLNEKINYDFDEKNGIKYFIKNESIFEILLPIDNSLILQIDDKKIILFCLQYNYFLKTKIFQDVKLISEGEITICDKHNDEKQSYYYTKVASDDEDIKEAFLSMNNSDSD